MREDALVPRTIDRGHPRPGGVRLPAGARPVAGELLVVRRGFSYISILTGVFQMFYLGFAAAGPAFFWTWPVVFLGQFTVALCFAELAAHYPLSGGVYQWSRRIGSPAWAGWPAGSTSPAP